jgi:streptogramin lyase
MHPRALRRWFALTLLALALVPATVHADGWVTMWGSGGEDPGYFDLPVGVATDPAGNVYVVDLDSDRIQKFTNDGVFITLWHLGSTGADPKGIAVDDGYVYVADGNGSRIVKYTTSGDFVMQWGSPGSGDGEFNLPYGITVGPDHSVYVADVANRRIEKFTSTGDYLTQWGAYGGGNGQFDLPRSLVTDPAGHVFVTDQNVARVQEFTSTGDYVAQWGTGTLGSPVGITLTPDGVFYIADAFFQCVSKFTKTGSLIESFGSFGTDYFQFRYPYSVAADAAGNVFVADYQNCRVEKYAPCPPPLVTVQPQPLAIQYGATATFGVTTTGVVGYQWVKDGSELTDGGRISGALTHQLTITGFQSSDVGSYWVEVRNWCNQGSQSDPAALTLAPPPSCFGPLAPPPADMAAWWAMEPGPGNTIPDVLHLLGNKNHASLTGAASLVPGKVGTAVRCPGVNDGLHVPSTLSPRLAANSTGLSIDAWILPRSGSSSNAFRMILEKGLLKHASTTVQGSTALAPGYAFYLCGGGRLGFQMPDPNYDPMRFEPAMAPMTMDEWHHVAVTVDPQKPQGGQFYLDGVGVGTFTPPSGILGNLADLYIGRFTPQLGPAAPDSAFNGDIDEVEIFVSAIDSSAVRKIWSAGCSGKRRVQVLTNSVVTLRENGAAAEICSSVLNLSDVAHTYQWSIAGGTPGVGCPSSVPVAFAPSSGSVTVAAGARADFSTSASVSPVSLTSPFTRCFRLTVTDLADGGVLTADGSLVFTGQPVTGKASCTPPEIGGATFAPTGMVRAASGLATFMLFNDAAAGVTVNYSIATRDPETGSASALLRLGGLPAGTPLTGSLFVPGLGSADLPLAVGLDEYEPFLPDEVVLSADGGGNLVFKELASVHVSAGDDTSLAFVGVSPGSELPPRRGLELRAAPNPFGATTSVSFALARDERVEVDVLDVSGRRVRRLVAASLSAGEHRLTWDGRDDAGASVRAGLYLARVRAGSDLSVVRLLRVR